MSDVRPWRLEGDRVPACLAELREPVERLYGCGDRRLIEGFEHERAVTIVGSRRATPYGLRVATELGRELARAGALVVSGMARGIDAAAHRGALEAGGRPVAVLASGPDVIYPASHRELYRRIVDSGAAISEYEPGAEARKHRFRDRDRIMAALGTVVVIVEAAQPSGSLITADHAVELGRMVGAVPGPVGTRSSAGANDLLREGAHVIRHATDVLDLMFGIDRDGRERVGPAIEPHLEGVLDLIAAGVATVDELALSAELDPRDAAISLAHLELLGYVESSPGGGVARTGLTAPRLDCEG